ncbi:fatty acid-binding protein 1, liver-like [Hemiscyllium ocellatum]|uniref:fatty acid-binding protein 1, liver-like n=1 Tax=Hemiscyllium ocellatum TaxID=170820 RepID=UPI00296606AC|nr:fatty acid-binding protein 1, liver-like [Hemiscyllium ocellatum]
MAFNGRYELQSQDKFAEFMKAIGLSDDLIEKGKDQKSTSEIVETGDHFKITVTTGSKVLVNEFTIGEETDIESPTGDKVKAIVNRDGNNKLVAKIQSITSVTEIIGDQLTNTMTIGDITYKRISKRIS